MRRNLVVVATSLLALTFGTGAASGRMQSGPSAQAPTVALVPPIQSCFSGGSGAGYFRACVSKRGNVVRLESPKGSEHVNVGDLLDGYVICKNILTSVAYDTAFSQSGFLAPVVTQPGGANTLPLTITRKTVDGTLRLTQTFGFDAPRRELRVTMKLTNLSGATLSNVGLGRAVDFDADGDPSDDVWDKSADGIWARDTHAAGLFAGSLGVNHSALAEDFTAFFNGVGSGSCSAVIVPSTPFTGDGAGDVGYGFPSIAAGVTTKPVVFVYRVF